MPKMRGYETAVFSKKYKESGGYMKNKAISRNFALYLIDVTVVCAVYLVTRLFAHFVSEIQYFLFELLADMVTVFVVYTAGMNILGVNKIIWRYSSGRDYFYIFAVSLLCGICSTVILELMPYDKTPFIYNFISVLICSLMVSFSRVVYREFLIGMHKIDTDAKKLLIVGAGKAGIRLLDEILTNPGCGLNPVGFVDGNPQKYGRLIKGIRVLGGVEDIPEICEENEIKLIYIAIPSATKEQRTAIFEICSKTNCAVKTLPYYAIEGRDTLEDEKSFIAKVRDITPEELLGREPVNIADENVLSFVKDKTVVITGGGGSIGSELCRQIAANSPKRLIIIDVYENNTYFIQQELNSIYREKLDLQVYIATVCDYKKINSIFAHEKPDIVIHAAAHKHVPLMETVPDECVKNNVFGTLNTALATINNKISKFILISTDKAVNPTNIMGTTKRICEMIIQYADSISTDTTFAAVRFGNVLGSNGSVIPIFKKQIENRNDVTVTHPEMIRYFMTIPEASQLVLTASAMAKGGEIFVLDMGDPVKIDDLARKMISLSGLVVGKDINIKYVGLRPGEKLYEELLMSEEGLGKTLNEKIFIGSPIKMDYSEFKEQLDSLSELVNGDDVAPCDVEKMLMEIVPTFKRFNIEKDGKAEGKKVLVAAEK